MSIEPIFGSLVLLCWEFEEAPSSLTMLAAWSYEASRISFTWPWRGTKYSSIRIWRYEGLYRSPILIPVPFPVLLLSTWSLLDPAQDLSPGLYLPTFPAWGQHFPFFPPACLCLISILSLNSTLQSCPLGPMPPHHHPVALVPPHIPASYLLPALSPLPREHLSLFLVLPLKPCCEPCLPPFPPTYQEFHLGIGITFIDMNVGNVKEVDRRSFDLTTPYRIFR